MMEGFSFQVPMKVHSTAWVLTAFLFCLTVEVRASAADLKQKTTDAFNRYVTVTEERMAGELKSGGAFLYPDRPTHKHSEEMRDAYPRLKRGRILVGRPGTHTAGK